MGAGKKAKAGSTAALKPRQILFCHEYMRDFNARQAALRAGYSESVADSASTDLLGDARIKAQVHRLMLARIGKVKVSIEDVLQSVVRLRAQAECEGRIDFALKANEMLGRHLKMFTDKVEQLGRVEITFVDEFSAALE